MPSETVTDTPTPDATSTDVVVDVHLNVQLTTADLAGLNDDQNRQLFHAIRTVATLTDLARTNAVSRRA